jgi:peptide-methionine (S)-S-oxide reductase
MQHLKTYLLGLLITLVACTQERPADAQSLSRSTAGKAPTNLQGLAVATFAGGCFWCTEEIFEELKGVKVGSGQTSHAESIQIYYDPKQISYATLVDVFLRAGHDPTTLNRQGPDAGTQYRSIAFYRTPQEKQVIDAAIKRVNASHQYSNPIVTQVVAYTQFWPAEDYHQGYFRLHPNEPYVSSVSTPKVEKFRHKFPELLKNPL